jgi:hypothetical protein
MTQPKSDKPDLAGRANRLRQTKWGMTISTVAIAAGWLFVNLLAGNWTVYDAGPLAPSHAMFRNECQRCHQRPKDASHFDEHVGKENAGPVPDAACSACHAGPLHHNTQVAAAAFRCAQCHREHRGQISLAQVADSFCTSCHSDLMTKSGPSADFARHISGFASHPEFAVLRRGPSHGKLHGENLRPGEEHKVFDAAEWIDKNGSWTWQDRTNLRFNHKYHLHPDGVLVPPGHPEYGNGKTLKRLECRNCHVPQADGRYMQPINYESHCKACHALDFSTKLHQIDSALNLTGSLPHVEPRLIRGVLRDRLLAYARAHPDVVRDEPAPQPALLPNKSPPEAPSAKDEWAWVESQLAQAAEVIAGAATQPRPGAVDFMHGCRHCHVINAQSGADPGAMLDWQIEPTNIPTHWLPHSQFRHDSHRMLGCIECHDHTPISTQTSDVLLPSIKVCQQCHTASRGNTGGARTDCVECHRYHNHASENVGLSKDEHMLQKSSPAKNQ